MTVTNMDVPEGVREWLRWAGPLHMLIGRLPDGWVDLTVTNLTGRAFIDARVDQHWDRDGGRSITVRLFIPGEKRITGDIPHVELPAPPEVLRRIAPPRPTVRIAVNPVTGTPHIMNGAVGLTGCGRRPRHGHAEWKYATAETTETHILFHDTMCKKCLQWFKREYEIK